MMMKMSLGNWLKKWMGFSIEQKLEPAQKESGYLIGKLGEQVLDGKAFLYDCFEADPVFLAKIGVPSISVYKNQAPLDLISNLAKKINGNLKVATGKADEVNLSADIVCVYSPNPICPSFMDNFVMKQAPYEVFISDCKNMSEEQFKLLAEYADKSVKNGKYILLKNVDLKKCAALTDLKHRNWTEIAHENTFCNDDYSVLYKKETDEIQILQNESELLGKGFDMIGRN